MFEKFLGRKNNPEVRAVNDERFAAADKKWWSEIINDPEFQDWFSHSVVVDEQGVPAPVYHGTRGTRDPWDIYKKIDTSEWGAHFGTAAAANDRLSQTFELEYRKRFEAESEREKFGFDRYVIEHDTTLSDEERTRQLDELDEEESPENMERYRQEKREQLNSGLAGGERIYPAFLNIQNPLRMSDPGAVYALSLERILYDLKTNFLTKRQFAEIHDVPDVYELRNKLIGLGFDGVVYTNKREGLTNGKPVYDSYIPLVGKAQIWPAFADEPLG
jgi:hypothetical protein